MATKKEKRAKAEEKRQRFLETDRRIGLEAQRKDREERQLQRSEAVEQSKQRNTKFQKPKEQALAAYLNANP